MARRPLALLASLFLLLVLGFGPAAGADEEAPAKEAPKAEAPKADPAVLTFADVFGRGRTFTKGIPSWTWRPGHKQLVRLDMRKPQGSGGAEPAPDPRRAKPKPMPRPILVVMDPETGKTEDLFDLGSIDAFVPAEVKKADGTWRKKKVTRMRGVGRAGPPRYRFTKDGKALCAVVRGDLVWVDLAKGTSRRLTHTEAPMADLNIAPDGSHVSFSRGNELWVVSTTEGKPYPLTKGGSDTLLNGTLDWVYPEELGFRTAAWWSPDGKHIAYLQMDQAEVPTHRLPATISGRGEGRVMRYPRAGETNPTVRVGVVPVGGGETRWVAWEADGESASTAGDGHPPVEYVADVAWRSPSHLVVTVLDRAQRQRRDVPVALEEGELATYATPVDQLRRGWALDQPAPLCYPKGSLFAYEQGACRRWAWEGGRLPGSTAAAAALTPEGVDARTMLHFDPASKQIRFSAIPSDAHTQGVFVGGPGVKELVRAPFAKDPFAWTSASIDESGTYALVTTESATMPPRRVLARVKDGEVIREIGNARAKALDDVALAVPEYGQIPVPGARKGALLGHIRWRLWKPKDFDPTKRYGLIVHTYGGPGSRMVTNRWGRGPLMTSLLCQKGFLVLEADGRGTSGQGADWLYAVQGKLGVLEVDDQATAVKHILARGYVDPARVGIWGWSYGGTMACNALTMRGDVFKAGVAVASVTDWRLYDSIYTERYMGLPKDNKEGYAQSSSITHAKKLAGHLLLIHGLGDDNVHVQNSMRLAEAFIKHKKTTWDLMLYAKRGHGIGGAQQDVFRRLLAWFETHLAPAGR